MKILLVSSRYLPHRGGLESVVYHLAREFTRQGHAVRIVTNRYPRSLPAEETIDGVCVTRLHFILPDGEYLKRFRFDLWLAGLWFRLITPFRLRAIMQEFQPDVVNNHYLNEVAELTGVSLSETLWIVSLHGGDVDGEPWMNATNRLRFQKITRRADGLTACSAFLANQAISLEPLLAGRIEVIHNGADVEKFSNARPSLKHPPYIFAVGQLAPHKGFDLLIRAFTLVAEKYPAVELWIAGEGSQHLALEALIRENDLTARIRLLGRVGENEIASLMTGALFIAMPSRRDAFGIVALEGMAAGKCVLATPVGGLPEFLLCPPNRMIPLDLRSWVQVLDEWLGDPDQLDGSSNIKMAEKHSWQLAAGKYFQVYQQVLSLS